TRETQRNSGPEGTPGPPNGASLSFVDPASSSDVACTIRFDPACLTLINTPPCIRISFYYESIVLQENSVRSFGLSTHDARRARKPELAGPAFLAPGFQPRFV